MSDANTTPYKPYGAFELKATYQRNLMLGNLAVISLVIALLVTAWIFSSNDPVVKILPVVPPESRPIEWKELPRESIIRPKPEFAEARPSAPDVSGGIPVAMPDSAVADPDAVIMSQADRADLLDWNGGDGPGEPGRFAVDPNLVEVLPPIQPFGWAEIPAKLIKKIPPVYPRLAKAAGIEGTVWIKALVSRTGTVLEAEVRKSSGSELLDAAALRVADQYLYKPAIQNGDPVPIWVTYRVDFVMED